MMHVHHHVYTQPHLGVHAGGVAMRGYHKQLHGYFA